MTPFRQKPHCAACSSMNACWIGCGRSSVPSPSSVVISAPSTRADRRHARADRAAADDHGAGAALAEAAAELRAAQREIVAEHVEQRRRRIDVDACARAVDRQRDGGHGSPDQAIGQKPTARVRRCQSVSEKAYSLNPNRRIPI